ncbi:MAG: acyltransferase [Eubacteriales bacterium]|nr:acyltransferase [Eubacteriales bacterium]
MEKSSAKQSKKGFSLALFSTKRDYLFGIATLMVVLFHSYIIFSALLPDAPWLADMLTVIKGTMNKGVEIFLFLSGIGLYYSMSKKPSLKEFYKKRATRILPALFIVSAIWFALREPNGLWGYLSDVFFITFFTEGTRVFWYFVLTIFLYIIYPLIHKLFEKTRLYGLILSVTAVVLINILLMSFAPKFYGNIEIALTRIPVFLVGAWIGKHVKDGVKISNLWLLVAFSVMTACFLFYKFQPISEKEYLYIYRYLGSFFAISLLFLWGAIFDKFSLGPFGTFLVWIGGYSMEIYLIQEKVGILNYNNFHTNDPTMIVYYFTMLIFTIILAMGLKALCNNLDRNLFYRNKKIKA